MSNTSDAPKRIAFVLNALTKGELEAGSYDVSRVHSLLTNPDLGGCRGPAPIHECKGIADFIASFNELLGQWRSDNQLVFYFSGHGETRRGIYSLKFGVSETDFFPFNSIMELITAQGVVRVIIILDACYSGHAIKGKSEKNPIEDIASKSLPQGSVIIASSRSTERSRELDDGSYSVFTKLFCEGIETGLGNEKTVDGMIYAGDIVRYITSKLEADDVYKAYYQRPVFEINASERNIWLAKNKSGQLSEQIATDMPPMIHSLEELNWLYEKTVHTEHPCPNVTLSDLNWDLVEQYAGKVDPELDTSTRDNNVLSALKLFSTIPYKGRDFLHKSAVLCFAKRPDMMYSEAKIVYVFGNPSDEGFLREDITGPLIIQVEKSIDRLRQDLRPISFISESGLRKERPEIDIDVLRELISNAVVHRDYALNSTVQVRIMADVLEIRSPGKFPKNLSWQKFLESAHNLGSHPINKAISQYISNLSAFDNIGRGFMMLKDYIEANGKECIEFKELDGPTVLVRIRRFMGSISEDRFDENLFGNAPSLPKLFVGREKDIIELELRLTGRSTSAITAIRGWPGIGKTTLAKAIAHNETLKETYPDGVLWTSLGQQPSITLELGNWLQSFGLDPVEFPTLESRSERLAAILRHRRMLLIVDDVWDAAHAEPFLVGSDTCGTLITTREPEVARALGIPNEVIYKLNVLTEEESLELLREIAPEVVDNNLEGTRKLVNDLERLPLALHVAGRLLAVEYEMGWRIEDLLAELAEGTRLLEEKAPADRTDLSTQTIPTIAALLEHSTNRLDEISHERFAMLGVFASKPATFDASAIGSVWDVNDPRPTIRNLVDRGLLEPAQNGRFQMHALLAMHARSMWEE